MNTNPDTPAAQQPIPADVLLNGGQTITVKTLKGETVDVKVRLIPVKELGKYLETVGDLANFSGFITGKDESFIDQLDDDALYAIDELGRNINSPRVARLLERTKVTLQEIGQITKTATPSRSL